MSEKKTEFKQSIWSAKCDHTEKVPITILVLVYKLVHANFNLKELVHQKKLKRTSRVTKRQVKRKTENSCYDG